MAKMRIVEERIVVYDAESAERLKQAVEGRTVHHIVVDNDRAYLLLKEGDDVERHIAVECDGGWRVRVTLGLDDVEIWGGDLHKLDCKVEVEVDEHSKIVEIVIPFAYIEV